MLAANWVDSIHKRLLVLYGARWLNLWAGVDADLVKQDWAARLSGLSAESIAFALENLPPEFPPTAIQFRGLCVRKPEPTVPMLPYAPGVAKVREVLSSIPRLQQARHPRQWAHDLRKRDQLGERLSSYQRFCWREALKQTQAEAA